MPTQLFESKLIIFVFLVNNYAFLKRIRNQRLRIFKELSFISVNELSMKSKTSSVTTPSSFEMIFLPLLQPKKSYGW